MKASQGWLSRFVQAPSESAGLGLSPIRPFTAGRIRKLTSTFAKEDDYQNIAGSPHAMSGASNKARFYLEQAVPQLQEFKEKKIFGEVSWLSILAMRERCAIPDSRFVTDAGRI
jgi:hypothetical protein